MIKNKTEREIGLEEYRRWKRGPWRGYYIVGRFLRHRYGLLDEDLKILQQEKRKYYKRNSRKKKRDIVNSQKEVKI